MMIDKKFYMDNCPQELSQRLKVEVRANNYFKKSK
jgi:hypothetical protein